jgi:type IV secretory pathway VirJ component
MKQKLARCAVFFILSLHVLLALSRRADAEQTSFSERFGTLHFYRQRKEPQGVALLFSSSEGWQEEERRLAGILLELHYAVIGIETKSYLQQVAGDQKECAYLVGEVEHLSQSAEHAIGMTHYHKPVLVGIREGAGLSYVLAAQSEFTFHAALGLSFCPELPLPRQLCSGFALNAQSVEKKQLISPDSVAQIPWTAINGLDGPACASSDLRPFLGITSSVPSQKLALLKPDLTPAAEWHAVIGEALNRLAPSRKHNLRVEPDERTLLPLIPQPSPDPHEPFFVVFLSGDGGWSTIDKSVGSYLSQQGVNVLGFDSLEYFWNRKEIVQAAGDLERAALKYGELWQTDKMILIGYSHGANVLPLIYNRLSRQMKNRTLLVTLLAPQQSGDFQVNIRDFAGVANEEHPIPLLPNLKEIDPHKLLCIFGRQDEPSVCEQLRNIGGCEVHELEGGHNFNNDYPLITKIILDSAKRRKHMTVIKLRSTRRKESAH